MTTDDHPDYGLSTYNYHTDGSGICYASRLRPMITMRPGFLSYLDARGSGLRHFPADTHLLDWLEAMGHDFDVMTDHDVHAEGVALIAPYKVVLTTSHPEYHTRETLDALSAYTAQGGRLMYLGGNGFYWRVALNPAWPGAVEIRRGEGGIRVWAAEPGEYYNSFDGQYGGLWRRNGRPPSSWPGWALPPRAVSRALTTGVNRRHATPVWRGYSTAWKTTCWETSDSAVAVRRDSSWTGRTSA